MISLWIMCVVLLWTTEIYGQRIQIEEVRLANQPNASSGRLEVRVGNEWGTVCDDQWDNLDAIVACRMLGFSNGGTAVTLAGFGQGTGRIFLDDVSCDGSETRLDECQMASTAIPINCLHAEDAGVVCDPTTAPVGTTLPTPITQTPATAAPVPDNCSPTSPSVGVRLVGFNAGMGILEVRNSGAWGSVCDDFFDENAAKVVCRSLCYDPVYARAGAPAGTFGSPRLPIILDDVICNGNEAQIQDCQHAAWGTHNCGQSEVAKVTCVDLISQPPQPPVPILDCREGYLIAAFSKVRDPFLERKHLTIANPINGACNRLYSEDNTTVIIRIPFENCGTNVSYNATHIIYQNVIKYDFTRLEGAITRVNTYLVEVFCEMPRRDTVTRPIDPLTQVVTQKSTGRFIVTMTFYRNNSFTNAANELPLRIPLGEWLNVALQLESVDRRLKLIVPDCKATPDSNMNNPINFPLFENSCRNEPTLAFFNLNQTRFGYRYQPFMFVNYQEVFLHCGAFVCLLSDGSAECDRSCNNSKAQPATSGRRKREAAPQKVFLHSGPMVVYKLDNSMTVVERIGRPAVWVTSESPSTVSSSTSTSSLSATTTPSPTKIGTSVKITYQSTTSSGGDKMTSTTPSTQTSTSAPLEMTSTTKAEPTSKSKTTMTSQDHVTTGQTTVPPPLKSTEPDPGFLIERGANLETQANTKVVHGYAPVRSGAPLLRFSFIGPLSFIIAFIATC